MCIGPGGSSANKAAPKADLPALAPGIHFLTAHPETKQVRARNS